METLKKNSVVAAKVCFKARIYLFQFMANKSKQLIWSETSITLFILKQLNVSSNLNFETLSMVMRF